MSTGMERFDPAAWHDGGVVYAKIESPKGTDVRRRPKGPKNVVFVASIALATSTFFLSDGNFLFSFNPTSVSREYESIRADVLVQEPSRDFIDASEWSRLILLADRLPRDETIEPDDVEPFI